MITMERATSDRTLERLKHHTHGNQTSDFHFAAYVKVVHGFVLRGIDGDPGNRWFVFDRDISIDLMRQFCDSPEKTLLDTHKALKLAVMVP